MKNLFKLNVYRSGTMWAVYVPPVYAYDVDPETGDWLDLAGDNYFPTYAEATAFACSPEVANRPDGPEWTARLLNLRLATATVAGRFAADEPLNAGGYR